MLQKIPIQRLRRDTRENEGQNRTARACNTCRQRKMKCDGNRPMCAQCQAQGLSTCVYSEAKPVQVQRQLESAKLKIKAYEGLLRDIFHRVDGSIAKQIASALKDPSEKQSEHQDNASSASSSSSIGSLDNVGTVSEDLNRSEESRATGYMGKNSEVTWMQRLESEATRQSEDSLENPPQSRLRGDDSIASMNYHLDHERLANPEVRNAFVIPPKALTDQLFHIYFDKVHDSLPIIRGDLFMEQYHRLFSEASVNPGRKWLAVFNMILAVSSRFCGYSKQDAQGAADEKIFFARAKSLNISENILYNHEDLQQVQAEVLMGFYFLAVSQINRYGSQKQVYKEIVSGSLYHVLHF